MRRISTLLLALFCGTLFAVEDDLRHVRSLSDRGLFATAEDFCNERFQQPDFAETDKILLAAELVRSYSQQLLLLEPAQRSRIIRRIESLESTQITVPPDSASPEIVLLQITFRLQCAMTYLSFGDDQRFEADTVSETNRRTAYVQARSTLHDSIERLKKCQQELQALRQQIGINADRALQQKMLALEYAITMQQGLARKSLALTFTAEEERHFELRQAVSMLSELASKNSIDPVIVQCKIEKATCHRLCGELDKCAEILNELRNVSLTPESQLRTEAEWIRYNLAAGNIAEMRRHYAADRPDGKLSPDFDLARLELFLVSNPSKNIRPETSAAMRLVQTIERQFGPYWVKRARMILLSSSNTVSNSAEILAMHAEKHEQEEEFMESAELYEQAAEKSEAHRQEENADRYYRLAARAWGKALERLPPDKPKTEYQKRLNVLLKKMAVQNPDLPDALELHLLAIDMQAQIVLSQPEALDDYLALVKEHEEHWNDSPQLQRLHRLSIILLERQGRVDEAAAMLPLLDREQLETLSPKIQRIRVRQLDADGKTQEAVNLSAALLKQRREPATLQLLAEMLTRQTAVKSLELALDFWTELAQNTERNSEIWWSAREGIFEVLCKLNRRDEAKKDFETLRILYPELGGTERKERLMKQFASMEPPP